MRFTVANFGLTGLLTAGLMLAPSASADIPECNDAFCTPGIVAGVELGGPCENTTFYAFGVDTRNGWGRLLFCGSPRRYAPRYFRSPPMYGIKERDSNCSGYENAVAQAPDGMFLTCAIRDSNAIWLQGDL